ncbi:MAG: hypothetical protein WD669_03895 [Pirellulales bacterium]
MTRLTYDICGDQIRFPDGLSVQLEFPLSDMIRNGDVVITSAERIGDSVLLRTGSPRSAMYGVDLAGRLHWRFEPDNAVADLPFDIDGNEMRFPNGKIARFDFPVRGVLQIGDILIAEIWPPRGTACNENIFGVDMTGSILWQIEPQYPKADTTGTFGGLHRVGDFAVVSNVRNDMLYLDPTTGRVVKRQKQMR